MEKVATREKPAGRGRPREFDTEEALAAALQVFWTKGYEGASLTELTDAMGITRPSLYAAFGNKEELFKSVLDLYEREKLAYVENALGAQTAKAVATKILNGAIDSMTGGECRGCLGVIASVACQAVEPSIMADIAQRTEASHRALVARMQRGIDDGDFPMPTDAEVITRFLKTILQGMSVQAQSGATAVELRQVADTAMAAWPSR